MKCIIFHTRGPNTQEKRNFRSWFLCFNWRSFSAFWRGKKQLFHIAPFHPTSNVLNNFGFLEDRNRVSNWNKGNPLISVGQYFKYANWKYRYSYTNLCSELSPNLFPYTGSVNFHFKFSFSRQMVHSKTQR